MPSRRTTPPMAEEVARYAALVDKQFTAGLTPAEAAEQQALAQQMDAALEAMYAPILARLAAYLKTLTKEHADA